MKLDVHNWSLCISFEPKLLSRCTDKFSRQLNAAGAAATNLQTNWKQLEASMSSWCLCMNQGIATWANRNTNHVILMHVSQITCKKHWKLNSGWDTSACANPLVPSSQSFRYSSGHVHIFRGISWFNTATKANRPYSRGRPDTLVPVPGKRCVVLDS